MYQTELKHLQLCAHFQNVRELEICLYVYHHVYHRSPDHLAPSFALPRRITGVPYAQPLLSAHVPTERPGPAPGSSVQRGYTSPGYNFQTFALTFTSHYFPLLLHWGTLYDNVGVLRYDANASTDFPPTVVS